MRREWIEILIFLYVMIVIITSPSMRREWIEIDSDRAQHPR